MTIPRINSGDATENDATGGGTPILPPPLLPPARRPFAQRIAHLPPPPQPPAASARRVAPAPFAAAAPAALANALPQLPRDVWANIVAHADVPSLFALRRVNRQLHRLSNRQIERICLDMAAHGASAIDFEGMPIGLQNTLLFRGDTRPPSMVFGLGFTKPDTGRPRISGEKVKGVISTSTEPNMVRRKYTEIDGYVYCVSGFPGIDTLNFNDLDEVAAFFIPPECIIAAIGPVAAFDNDNYVLVINNPRVLMNPNGRLSVDVMRAARAALAALCRAPTPEDEL